MSNSKKMLWNSPFQRYTPMPESVSGLPWLDHDLEVPVLKPQSDLESIKSITQLAQAHHRNPLSDHQSASVENVVRLGNSEHDDSVINGEF